MRHKAINIMLIAVSIFVLVGSSVTAYLLTQSEESQTLTLDLHDGMREELSFEDLCMVPGEEVGYDIRLEPEISGDYELSFEFTPGKETALAPFLFARVELGGERITELPITELFLSEPLTVTAETESGNPLLLKIVYTMPSDVGNEAQAATLDFVLEITASSEAYTNE